MIPPSVTENILKCELLIVANRSTKEYFISIPSSYQCLMSELQGRWLKKDMIYICPYFSNKSLRHNSIVDYSFVAFGEDQVDLVSASKPTWDTMQPVNSIIKNVKPQKPTSSKSSPPPRMQLIHLAILQGVKWSGAPYEELLKLVKW